MTGTVVRLGVLGCADIAVRKVLPTMVGHPDVRLLAVASRNGAKAAATAGRFGCEPVTGYSRLLDRDDIDAVYVPLPPALHATWIKAALAAGKHVLAEKPLTPHQAETHALAELAAKAGRVLMENVMFLHQRRHRHVRELLADGAIGELIAFTGSFTVPPRPTGDFRHSVELGGGALLDAAIYPAVAAQLFLGRGLRVVGATLRHAPHGGADIAGAALLDHPNGHTAQIMFGLNHRYASEYHLLGTRGRITVGHAFHLPAGVDSEIHVEVWGREEGEIVPVEPDDQCGNTVTAFVEAVRSGHAGLVGDTVLSTAGLLEDIRYTARKGCHDARPGQ